jgi:hypothetical protein
MKQRHLILAATLAGAAWLAFFGDKTPAGNIAEPVVRAANRPAVRPAAPSASHATAKAGSVPEIEALIAREELIGGAQAAAGASVALFGSQNWNPPQPPPPKPAPPPPPTAPPVPFTYLGKKSEDGKWEVYVGRGDQTLILHENSEIDGTYRVDAIRPPTMTLTYLPLKQSQTLAIGGAE